MGQVIGHSNKEASAPQSDPVRIPNLLATILNTLFDVGELRLTPGLPREVAQTMTSWEPIPGLMYIASPTPHRQINVTVDPTHRATLFFRGKRRISKDHSIS